jgi:YggT family protein
VEILAVSIIATIAYYLFLLYFFVMWARFIVDMVRMLNRSWRPKGFGLILVEATYAITDPPIKFFRRLVPQMSMGPVAIDFGWSLTMLACIVGLYISLAFR